MQRVMRIESLRYKYRKLSIPHGFGQLKNMKSNNFILRIDKFWGGRGIKICPKPWDTLN
jgi:hypothetical protein